jgi:hypothetical protein
VGIAQEIEHLPSKNKALSSKNKRKRKLMLKLMGGV